MKDFKKYYKIEALPAEIYLALTNPFTIELWTGEKAEMSTEPDSEFSLWDGAIVGRNIEFEQDKKIVQEWYFGETETPSVVTIKLHESSATQSQIEVRQTNIPDEDYADIVEGWNDTYLAALIRFFEED